MNEMFYLIKSKLCTWEWGKNHQNKKKNGSNSSVLNKECWIFIILLSYLGVPENQDKVV